MARQIHSRYKISGTLIAQSPVHVGGLGGNVDTDLALAVNGRGQYYIPGTSLAGALRAWMERFAPEVTKYLWGFQEQKKEDSGHASFVIVEDAVINSSAMVEIRDGVGIDRHWGVAAERMKYDRALLPKGVKFKLHLTLERDASLTDEEWESYQAQFAQLLAALEDGEIYLGAAKTRGLGRVKLYGMKVREEQLFDREGMLATLLSNGKQVDWSDLIKSNRNSSTKLSLTIHWQPCGPVMVKAEGDGIAVDLLPLVSPFAQKKMPLAK
ncbi:MAG: RAMP superfamily CRISPR-associated protein [Xenococcaceae cyanobacterium]